MSGKVVTYIIEEVIRESTLSDLVEFLNSNGGEKRILISSDGGYYQVMEAMLHLINADWDNITLVAYNRIYSSAFELFFRAKCHKRLAGGVVGMFHQGELGIQINEFGVKGREATAKEQYIKTYMRQQTKDLCGDLSMTFEEIKDLEDGEDVYFSPERMNQFLIKNNGL